MKVILIKEVENLGKEDDVVQVRDGFARNYLFPKGLAIPASPSNLKHLRDKQQAQASRQEKIKRRAKELATRIEELILKTYLPIGEEGSFGRITAGDIAELLKKEGVVIDKKCIILEEPLRSPGVYDVEIRLAPEQRTVLKLWVLKEEK